MTRCKDCVYFDDGHCELLAVTAEETDGCTFGSEYFKRDKNGKYVMEFDEIPRLLFVSTDGHGTWDKTFINGELQRSQRNITINSEAGGLTTYTAENYALDPDDL